MSASVIEIIRREFPFATEGISSDAHLRDDLGLDSMDLVQLQIALEDEFGIRFDPSVHDLDALFTSVASITRFLAERDPKEGGHV